MLKSRATAASMVLCLGISLAIPARAEPTRVALVIGNGLYTSLPAIPACARSAHAVTAALRGIGFDVTEREDASSGGIDSALAEFSRQLVGGPAAAAFVYVCGYGTSFNNRPFLLPTTANITRPSDVLTQGVLAKSMIDTVGRDGARAAVVALDVVPKPDGPAQIGVETLADIAVPEGVGIIATTETTQADGPTPLATALITGLAGPVVRSDELLGAVRARLAANKLTVAALHMPGQPGYLAGALPPAMTKPEAAPPVVVAPATGSPPPTMSLPDESEMNEADRQKVQDALTLLGYYSLPVDGVFGPETRAAIRRYQHEIGGDMTGRLTAAQASRLVSTH